MPNKTLMCITEERSDMLTRSTWIVRSEFVELSGVSAHRLDELLEMGWLVPTRTAEAELLFQAADVYRLRKLERLCHDFELHTIGGTIIVDLLSRIEELENKLKK